MIVEEKFYTPHLSSKGFRHVTLFDTGAKLSTVYGDDTLEYESMFITPEEKYILLQTYEEGDEALKGHQFWSRKICEGFVPAESLVDNFTLEAGLRFLAQEIKRRGDQIYDR